MSEPFGKKLRRDGPRISILCPACDMPHSMSVEVDGARPVWGFNNNGNAPTFTPSLLVTHDLWTPPVTPENLHLWREKPWEQHQVKHVCHSFITDGRIQFLSDCTHALANQTVDLPDWGTQ